MVTRPKRSPLLAIIGFTAAVTSGSLMAPAVAGAQPRVDEPRGVVAPVARKIWEDRGPIETLDLYWGNASPERAPVGPFTFLSEDLGATNPKAIVRDARGVRWNAKWDEEVQSEVAATRLAWAMGLGVEETYYVETGTILFTGPRPTFQRIGSFIDKAGKFKQARFERRGPELVKEGAWPFAKNPLRGEAGYSVLVLMDVVMANWDAKDSNNKILAVTNDAGTTEWYMIGDYGACFGKMGGTFGHSKFQLKGYAQNPPVIASVNGRMVALGYKGSNASYHASVPLEGARLFADRAAGLSLKQVEDAFRAAHANDAELQGFSRAVYQRIQEVVTKVRQATGA